MNPITDWTWRKWAVLGLLAASGFLASCMTTAEARQYRDDLADTLAQVEQTRDEWAVQIADLRASLETVEDDDIATGLANLLAKAEREFNRLDNEAGDLSVAISEIEDGPGWAMGLDIISTIGLTLGLPLGGLGVFAEQGRRRWKRDLGTVVESVSPLFAESNPDARKLVEDIQGPRLTGVVKEIKAGARPVGNATGTRIG